MNPRQEGQQLNLARLAWSITSLGPGYRLGLWVAGCQMRCKGCISPELQSPAAGRLIHIDALTGHILGKATALGQRLDGISISGGEPFDQASALAALWQRLRQAQPNWNLLVFSGYPWSKLQQWPEAQGLLRATDMLIAGPYQLDNLSDTQLQASANQQRLALTSEGGRMLATLENAATQKGPSQRANLGFDSQGRGWLVGVFHETERRKIHQKLGLMASSHRPCQANTPDK